jgi:Flp pilus assembly pilin Flp
LLKAFTVDALGGLLLECEEEHWPNPIYSNNVARADSCLRKRVGSVNLVWALAIGADNHGQEVIEFALMAGFVAVAAGAIVPSVGASISKVFSKSASTMTAAAATSQNQICSGSPVDMFARF